MKFRISKILLFVLIVNLIITLKTEFLTTARTSTNTENKTHNKNKSKVTSSGRINMSEGKMKLHTHELQSPFVSPINSPTVLTPMANSQIQPLSYPLVPNQPMTAVSVPTLGVLPNSAINTPMAQATPECDKASSILQPIKGDASENGEILFTSWIKYFKMVDVGLDYTTPPKTFYKNNFYYEQLKQFPGIDLTKVSTDGINTLEEFIKSPSYFYAVLFPNNLNILTSRQVILYLFSRHNYKRLMMFC
jgi:hypothetical protein